MTEANNRVRTAIQKLTEAIWNPDQLDPLDPGLRSQYESIQTVRHNLMKERGLVDFSAQRRDQSFDRESHVAQVY